MKNIPIPRIHTYKELSHRINQIDIGELSDVRETLCIGIDDECKFSRRYRDLLQPLLKMTQFYLSANNKRDKLNWFGKQEGSFKVAIGRDGAPFQKDDQALAQLVSFLNCGRRVCSSAAKILLFGANWSEDCEPVCRYVAMLHVRAQMRRIEGNCILYKLMVRRRLCPFSLSCLQMTWNIWLSLWEN